MADGNSTTRQTYFETLAAILDGPQPRFDPDATARHSTGLNKRCDVGQLLELGVTLSFGDLSMGIQDSVKRA